MPCVDAGIRTVYTPAIFDVPDAGPGSTWEALLADACAVVDATAGKHELVQMGFGPHAAYTVPPEGLRAIAAEARARDALLQVHLSETDAECRVVQERYGMSAPALLASEGVLDGRVLAAHAVWLDDADLSLLAEHDVAVAHCPGSNGKLGSGIAPLRALLDRGVRVGLGTDGPASNDDLHLWDEMRLAPLLARAVAGDPDVLSSAAALRLATRGGGEALGLAVGALEAGRPADLIRLRTDDARFTPAMSDAELLGHLVWAGAGYLVTDVWVGGGQVVARGVHDGRRRTRPVRGGPARPPPPHVVDGPRGQPGRSGRRSTLAGPGPLALPIDASARWSRRMSRRSGPGPVSWSSCPDSSTRPSCTHAPEMGEPGRCRGAGRPTWTAVAPTGATAVTAGTCGSSPR